MALYNCIGLTAPRLSVLCISRQIDYGSFVLIRFSEQIEHTSRIQRMINET